MGNNHISTIYVDMSQETLVLMGFMKGFINPNLKQCIQWIPLKGATPPFQSPVVPVDVSGRYRSIVMTNIAMEAMAHRNRWFSELKNGDFPWRTVSHNQMVDLLNLLLHTGAPPL